MSGSEQTAMFLFGGKDYAFTGRSFFVVFPNVQEAQKKVLAAMRKQIPNIISLEETKKWEECVWTKQKNEDGKEVRCYWSNMTIKEYPNGTIVCIDIYDKYNSSISANALLVYTLENELRVSKKPWFAS